MTRAVVTEILPADVPLWLSSVGKWELKRVSVPMADDAPIPVRFRDVSGTFVMGLGIGACMVAIAWAAVDGVIALALGV